MRRHGLALILVAGVLGLLAVLATAFVTMAQLERRASVQRLNATKAMLLARSGIEDALARHGAGQDANLDGTRYGGEDWNLDGLLNGIEATDEVYGDGRLDVQGCPARQAMRPSFFARDGFGSPVLKQADGRRRGITGTLFQGTYALRVLPQGGLHVNGALSDPGYQAVLARLLGNLAEELGPPLSRPDGEAIVSSRPPGGWSGFGAIRDGALGGSEAKLAAIRPYLALEAWVDRRVIRPTATAALEGVRPKAHAELRKGASDDGPADPWTNFFTGGRNGLPAFQPRAPVNLAWARHQKPLITALARDLSGLWLKEDGGLDVGTSPEAWGDALGKIYRATITLAEARRLADVLAAHTGPLDTWLDFNTFCDTLGAPTVFDPGTPDEIQAKRDLLKANFNPNTDLNKFNPNPTLWKRVDKADLLLHSTEFCLEPVHGVAVASAGRILDPSGRTRSLAVLEARLAPPRVLRLSTQREFVCGDLGDLEGAGDEGAPRLPGDARFIMQSHSVAQTWGHLLPGLGGAGAGLQSYPEPCYDAGDGDGLQMSPADYDGHIQLATLETESHPRMTMLAGFTRSLDLDVFKGTHPQSPFNQPDDQQVRTSELALGLLDPAKPNTLYPDGCHSGRHRAPAYLDKGNAPQFHGLLSFWFKPDYDAAALQQRGHRYVNRTNYLGSQGAPENAQNTQFFFVGNANLCEGMAPSRHFVTQFEIGHDPEDEQREHRFWTPNRTVLPHRWYLLTLYWNFQSADRQACGEMLIDDGDEDVPANLASRDSYGDLNPNIPNMVTAADDITEDAPLDYGAPGISPHRIILGRGGQHAIYMDSDVQQRCGSGADVTFDEFAIYDFGTVEGSANTLAARRYPEGRYYRGWAWDPGYLSSPTPVADDQAATYVSAQIDLGTRARLRSISWTWYRPEALPDDYAEVALVQPEATSYLWDVASSRSTTAPGWNPRRQDWRVGRPLQGPFCLQVVFRRPAALDLNVPILDSPVLDDLTLVLDPPAGPSFLAWGRD